MVPIYIFFFYAGQFFKSKEKERTMFEPAAKYLQDYRECRKKRTELRKSLQLPKNDEEDYQFCKKYYKLYVVKLVIDLL